METAVAEARTRERQAELAGAEQLLEGVRSIDHAQSLSEVLHLLADKAAEIVPRVALFVVQDERLRSWRMIGFPGELATTGFETGLNGDELLGSAALSGQAVTTSSADRRMLPPFASLKEGRAGIAVPLEVGGETVAVLYADADADDPARMVPSAWPEVAELLSRHAARCLQAVTGSRIAEALTKSEV
ncbi:MAG: GAF domain-containing protein [Acidobacteria bacterium]|nr:GAF domain-containing protein [Acidobacteriota bacterium]